MLQGDRAAQIEWALGLEFGQKCRVRFVPPGQPLPITSARDAATYSASTAMQTTPQHVAHLERPPIASALSSSSGQIEQEVADFRVQEPPTFVSDSSSSNGVSTPGIPSVARTNALKENTTIARPHETIEQRARQDPIVQEAMRTFMADIVEVRQK